VLNDKVETLWAESSDYAGLTKVQSGLLRKAAILSPGIFYSLNELVCHILIHRGLEIKKRSFSMILLETRRFDLSFAMLFMQYQDKLSSINIRIHIKQLSI